MGLRLVDFWSYTNVSEQHKAIIYIHIAVKTSNPWLTNFFKIIA